MGAAASTPNCTVGEIVCTADDLSNLQQVPANLAALQSHQQKMEAQMKELLAQISNPKSSVKDEPVAQAKNEPVAEASKESSSAAASGWLLPYFESMPLHKALANAAIGGLPTRAAFANASRGQLSQLLDGAKGSLLDLLEKHSKLEFTGGGKKQGTESTRSDYMLALPDCIGTPEPSRTVSQEIDTLFQENKIKDAYGHEQSSPAGLWRSVDGLLRYYPDDEENRVASLLIYAGGELGATMNDDRPNNKYANIIYTGYQNLCKRAKAMTKPAPDLYMPLDKWRLSLSQRDPNWRNILKQDRTGFCGFTSTVSTLAQDFNCTPSMCWTEAGLKFPQVVDSPIVCIKSSSEDDRGMHTAVKLGPVASYGDAFLIPPLTLYKLVSVAESFVHVNTHQFMMVDEEKVPVTRTGNSDPLAHLGFPTFDASLGLVHIDITQESIPSITGTIVNAGGDLEAKVKGKAVLLTLRGTTDMTAENLAVLFEAIYANHGAIVLVASCSPLEGYSGVNISLLDKPYPLPVVILGNAVVAATAKRVVDKLAGGSHVEVRLCTAVVKQPLITVHPTYLLADLPVEGDGDDDEGCGKTASKMAGTPDYLSYGARDEYVRGVGDVVDDPVLTMEAEFMRDQTWEDWQGNSYSAWEEWSYVVGTAKAQMHVHGARDTHHNGKSIEEFMLETNAFIRIRLRQQAEKLALITAVAGAGAGDGSADAECDIMESMLLTREEVIAVRLYTGPPFAVINRFLRELAKLSAEWRRMLARTPKLTYSATVGHLHSAVRKLARVTDVNKCFRGVKGSLPPTFNVRDIQGFVSATEFGFMSTSTEEEVPRRFMSTVEPNVLWELDCRAEDEAFHNGADVSMLSQFATEKEVLFPPLTMLLVCGPKTDAGIEDEIFKESNGKTKRIKRIKAIPYYI